jgi:Holliday junction resolvase RusA-like endonuclease
VYRLEIYERGLPPLGNAILRMHFRAYGRLRKRWEMTLLHHAMKLGAKPLKPLERARITVTRYSATEPDADNLRFAGKPILDAMKRVGLILDDKPAVIGTPEFKWVKVPAKQGGVKIVLEEVDAKE